MSLQNTARNVYSFNSFGSRALVRYLLVEHRSSLLAALDSVALSPDELLQGNRVLSGQEQAPIWGLACQLKMSHPLLAFKAAKLHDLHDSGLPAILARSCATPRDVLEIHQKYLKKMDSEGVLSDVVVEAETVSYVFKLLSQYPAAIQEYALATTWMALTALSPEAQSCVVTMEFPGSVEAHGLTPVHLESIKNDYAIEPKFSAGRLALVLKKTFLDIAIPTVDPGLRIMLERKLRVLAGDTLAEDTEELRSQVFAAILQLRTLRQAVSLESVSEFMGVKSETLSYALRSHGISFQRLKAIVE
ncbi:hypothetical protein EBU99_10290 [bacterium]|nr:hypothetical protein [bacterium]